MEVEKAEVESIEGLFSDVKQISEPDIRRKVVEAFTYACHNGFYPKKLEEEPSNHDPKMKEISLVNRFNAVTRNAMAIAKNEMTFHAASVKLNMDFIIACGLLHDIGKLGLHAQRGQSRVERLWKANVAFDCRRKLGRNSMASSGDRAQIAVHSIESDLPGVRSIEYSQNRVCM